MQHSILTQLEELAAPVVAGKNAFIVDLQVRGEQGGKAVELFIDADTGVTTALCADVSREISRVVDEADLFRGRYHLVVSSPGIDRPLKFPRQYIKHKGRTLALTLKLPDKVEGKLIAANESGIEIEVKNEGVRTIAFADILEARVQASW